MSKSVKEPVVHLLTSEGIANKLWELEYSYLKPRIRTLAKRCVREGYFANEFKHLLAEALFEDILEVYNWKSLK